MDEMWIKRIRALDEVGGEIIQGGFGQRGVGMASMTMNIGMYYDTKRELKKYEQ